MVVAQGQKGVWMRTPISLIAYTYASHSENTTLMQITDMHRFQNNQRRGGELWSFFLMLQTAPALWRCSVPSVLLSDQCLSGHRDHEAQPSPTPSAGYLGKCHTTGIYHPWDSSKQACLCTLSHTQTSCPCVRPKWDQLYAIKSVITAWINTSQYLLFPKVVNKPVICSQAWGFIRARAGHSALGPSSGATDTS